MSPVVSGWAYVLKLRQKQRLNKVALETDVEAGEPSLLMSVGTQLTLPLGLLIAFQKSFQESSISASITGFLILLYFGRAHLGSP